MRSIYNQGHAYLLEAPQNFMAFIVLAFAMVIIFGIMSLTWGITALVGVVFIAMAFAIILLGRGGEAMTPWIFLVSVALGTLFLILAYLGVSLGTVDLSFIPGLEFLHNAINPAGCMTCP